MGTKLFSMKHRNRDARGRERRNRQFKASIVGLISGEEHGRIRHGLAPGVSAVSDRGRLLSREHRNRHRRFRNYISANDHRVDFAAAEPSKAVDFIAAIRITFNNIFRSLLRVSKFFRATIRLL